MLEGETISCTTHSNTNLVGKLYATSTGNTFNANMPNTTYIEENGLREPDIVGDDDGISYLNIITNILTEDKNASKYADITTFKNTMQEDFNNMAKSVAKYNGFYIGRYEMSKSDDNTAQSKANSTVLTADTLSANKWYGLYAYGKTYTNNANSVVSSMVYGSQYDMMMKWMQENGENVTDKEPSKGKYNSNPTITGSREDTDIIKNVYDLYGGRIEWTLEASDIYYRVSRGRRL